MAAAVGTTRHLIFWHHQVMVTSSGTSGPAFDILAPTVVTSYGTSGPTYHHPTPSTGRIVEGRPAKEARGDPREGIMVSLPAFDETGNQGSWRMAKQGHLRRSLLAITCVESSGRGNKEQEATKKGGQPGSPPCRNADVLCIDAFRKELTHTYAIIDDHSEVGGE
ncbi:hypothetical protein PVAP13_1NG059944 [Panicum virgatum]|uniref:Uncharacterized protein n=1 Tax=Panicum virgatum TaxID=38727 RepID=A0A8T0WHY2_PANVG|nr:hypothetical protein PVAP13_1NG059944 [Panicum virgatum]